MHDITTEGITFFAFLWAVAFASTVARAIRDGDSSSWLRCAGLGATAGFLAVGIVAVWIDRRPGGVDTANSWFWVGIASLIGGLGKEQDKVRGVLWGMLVQSLRVAVEPDKKSD